MVPSVMMPLLPLPLVEETVAVLGLPRHHWCWRSRRTTALEAVGFRLPFANGDRSGGGDPRL
jgi:hypothetical protein